VVGGLRWADFRLCCRSQQGGDRPALDELADYPPRSSCGIRGGLRSAITLAWPPSCRRSCASIRGASILIPARAPAASEVIHGIEGIRMLVYSPLFKYQRIKWAVLADVSDPDRGIMLLDPTAPTDGGEWKRNENQ